MEEERTEKHRTRWKHKQVYSSDRNWKKKGRKSTGQDGNTNRYTVVTGTGTRKDGKAQDKMETQTGIQ